MYFVIKKAFGTEKRKKNCRISEEGNSVRWYVILAFVALGHKVQTHRTAHRMCVKMHKERKVDDLNRKSKNK